ncbi:hypothetical protein [Bradyrhizobium sp. RDI18]|uniref:hypothetical protein n=1 Tax=Bradyrhizobium sp. RDI18 TaxID=3367400 RepID=UPI003715F23C
MTPNRREAVSLLSGACIAPLMKSGAFAQAASPSAAGMSKGPPRNPFLSAEKYAVTHFDAGQSDSFPYPVARGTFHVDLWKQPRVRSGPINIMTLASASPDYMWGVSSKHYTYIDVSGGGLREVTRFAALGPAGPLDPDKLDQLLKMQFTDVPQLEKALKDVWGVDDKNWASFIAGGTYSVVDRENVLYINSGPKGSTVYAIGLNDPKNPSAGIKVLRSIDVANILKTASGALGEGLTGLNMTYDGKLIILGRQSVAVIDANLTGQPHVVTFGEGEYVSNACAVDEKGGIYVASDKIMRKVVWTGAKLSMDEADGAWAAPYDFGRQPPAVKIGIGTGSTPTLMGFGDDPDKLVVITDGADRMKLVAFWRDQIPNGWQQQPGTQSPRIAGQIQVTCGLSPAPEFVQSEQSVVVNGYGAFVVNNMRAKGADNRLVDVIGGGPIFDPPAGCERFEWNPKTHAWRSVWTRNDVSATSQVPTMSSASNIVLTNGYTKQDGWVVTGMDWNTGETVHQTIFGQDNLGNGAYALMQFLPNGDMLFNSIGGPTRVKLE